MSLNTKLLILTNDLGSMLEPLSGNLEDSKIVTGTVALINDVSKVLLVLAPIIGGATLGYFAIRKMNADDHDAPMWKKRMINVAICTVLVFLASIIITVVTGYYK